MRPGNFSQAGFIGADESLVQVLAADARSLAELGLDARTLADALGRLLEAAALSAGATTQIDRFRIRLRRYKGVQICPYAPEPHANPCPRPPSPRFASMDWEIQNRRTGAKLAGPGLIVHLIGAHGFFEGSRSPYRVAPRALAKLLELGPFGGPARPAR